MMCSNDEDFTAQAEARAELAEAEEERFKSLYEGAMMYQKRAHDLADELAEALKRSLGTFQPPERTATALAKYEESRQS